MESQATAQALPRFDTNRGVYAVLMGLLSLLLGGIGAFLFVDSPENIGLAADSTILRFTVLTFYISMAVSLIGYRLLTSEEDGGLVEKLARHEVRRDWLGRISVSFAVAWILSAVCQALFLLIISRAFASLELPRIVMMVVFVLYASILGFGVAYFIVTVDNLQLNWLLGLLAVGGILFSATLVSDPDWWQHSVSQLGIDTGSGAFFNITIVIVGLVMLTLARDLIAELKLLTEARLFPPTGFQTIRNVLTATGLGIIGVGLFPTQGAFLSHELHLWSAYSTVILYILTMLFLNRIAPDIYPKSFIYFSAFLGIISILTFVTFLAGSLQFTLMELILFALIGVWVTYFRALTKQYARQQVLPTTPLQPA